MAFQNSVSIWLIRLRFLTAASLLLVLLACRFIANVEMPWLPLSLIFLVLFLSNLAALLVSRRMELSTRCLGLILLFDILLFTAILFWTGGAHNPLSILYIVGVALAAVILGQQWTLATALLSAGCFALLFLWSKPFPLFDGHHGPLHGAPNNTHLYGMWLGYVLTAFFVTYFLSKVTAALESQREEVMRLRLLALKQEQLAALVSFAGGAAHELSTPLATIALITSNFADGITTSTEATQDMRLIQSEVQRCKEILARLNSQSGQALGEVPSEVSSAELESELRFRLSAKRRNKLHSYDQTSSQKLLVPKEALLQSLLALINNAFDASGPDDSVQLRVDTKNDCYSFLVSDCGKGMSTIELQRLGEPFYSTKPTGFGMGLGVFLVKLFAERIHGRLHFQSDLGKGTIARLEFSPSVFA